MEIVMGATVTTRKKVFAKEVGGQVFYWLVEWTYEKNCYPHVAHESCVAFGRAEKVFPRMFGMASNCEGGMLQSPSGRISPEGYIRDWLKKMSNPEVVVDKEVVLSVGQGWSTPIKDDQLADVALYLRSNGLADHATVLNDSRKALFSFNVLEEMLALEYFANNVCSPWKIFHNLCTNSDVFDASLGYVPGGEGTSSLLPAEVPKGMKVDNENYVLLSEDGKLRLHGWAYSIIGKFIQNEPARAGFNPMNSLKRIKQYRMLLDNLPSWEAKTWAFVVINRSSLADWEKSSWAPENMTEKISHIEHVKLMGDDGENILVRVSSNKASSRLPGSAVWNFVELDDGNCLVDGVDRVFARSEQILVEHLASACQASDVDEAIEKLMAECGELFQDRDCAWKFLMTEGYGRRISFDYRV